MREGDRRRLLRHHRGHAVVEHNGSQLRELGEGDFFGEISLIDGQPRSATITATDEVSTLTLGREQFQRLIDEHPSVGWS